MCWGYRSVCWGEELVRCGCGKAAGAWLWPLRLSILHSHAVSAWQDPPPPAGVIIYVFLWLHAKPPLVADGPDAPPVTRRGGVGGLRCRRVSSCSTPHLPLTPHPHPCASLTKTPAQLTWLSPVYHRVRDDVLCSLSSSSVLSLTSGNMRMLSRINVVWGKETLLWSIAESHRGRA